MALPYSAYEQALSVLFFTKVKLTKTETDPKTLDMSTPTRWLRGLAALLPSDYIGLSARAKGRGHYCLDLCSKIDFGKHLHARSASKIIKLKLVQQNSSWMTATGIPPQVVMFGLQQQIQST
ncbi:hypothetical protein L915_20990, partial [Phytophthora nicotianae]